MRRTWGWLTVGLIVLGVNVAGAQEKPDLGTVGAESRGANIAVPSAGVDVNTAPGGGVGVTAPGVNVNVPPVGSGAGVGVNVPAAGIHANVNPNAWHIAGTTTVGGSSTPTIAGRTGTTTAGMLTEKTRRLPRTTMRTAGFRTPSSTRADIAACPTMPAQRRARPIPIRQIPT